MVIPIDQSPRWRTQHAFDDDLDRILEALFRGRRGRRPVSGLEVLILADALECSEATIGRHFATWRQPAKYATGATSAGPTGGLRLLLIRPRIQRAYSPTKPA